MPERRTHDELHRDHQTEYNLIVDLDHDIALIDDMIYGDTESLKRMSVELRNTLDSGDMEKFKKDLEILQRKVRRAPKVS